LEIDPNTNWEIAIEVCFYRDLNVHQKQASTHSGMVKRPYSLKRTFDLTLFSDDVVVVIEAKAQQPFNDMQLEVFRRDRTEVAKAIGISEDSVYLLGLCSSKHEVSKEAIECFHGKILRWSDLAIYFDDDLVLQRADAIYENQPITYGLNNRNGYKTGAELREAFIQGEEMWVGRYGGYSGAAFKEDLKEKRWQTQRYETNHESEEAPNRNWFTLSDFVRRTMCD
jgi:hypothetical protein